MQITGSIGQRYGASRVRVMGFADSRGDKGYNKGLSAKRAEAVKSVLVTSGRIAANRVSVEPTGEAHARYFERNRCRPPGKSPCRNCGAHQINAFPIAADLYAARLLLKLFRKCLCGHAERSEA